MGPNSDPNRTPKTRSPWRLLQSRPMTWAESHKKSREENKPRYRFLIIKQATRCALSRQIRRWGEQSSPKPATMFEQTVDANERPEAFHNGGRQIPRCD